MNERSSSSKYINRGEQQQIKEQLDAVRNDGQSRAVALYGSGGVGKTSLVRHMAWTSSDPLTTWLDPIDVDDPEYWLLSNLERRVANRLDPDDNYFRPFRTQLSKLPNYTRSEISRETIVSYLGRIKGVFADCYNRYVEAEQRTVVIIFDTVETIRGTNLLLTLTQWMKALPKATLFILSGRPLTRDDASSPDPIITELVNPYQGIPVIPINVGGLSISGANEFIERNGISDDLIDNEKQKLILLTRGHPLWLAFTIEYLRERGIPEEAEQHSLDYIAQHIPYGRDMTSEGRRLHQEFLRRLVAPYQGSDFWHEAIKRLAVVRQPIAKVVWQELMADLALPEDSESLDDAWERLLDIPWVRPRGNSRYVTLHDAVAEEFAQRLFPLHDQNQEWRRGIWQRALAIYNGLVAQDEAQLVPELAALDADLKRFDTARPDGDAIHFQTESEAINYSVRLDARKRELDQLKAASLYYLFLFDFERGSEELLLYFRMAEMEHDVFIQDLLVLYLQRFLPGGTSSGAFNDVIKAKLDEFRDWLENERRDYYIAIGITVARYLIEAAQPENALHLLNQLPEEIDDSGTRYRLHILRGNACMRIPGSVKEGLIHFDRALVQATALTSIDRHKFIAQAHKERGFYYRNTGEWQEADLSYKHARDAISPTLSVQSSAAERDEMASIQTNWAYVKGLDGSYSDGWELVESAITVRRRLGLRKEEAISWSVCGEVYRYARRFERAWAAYSAAEQLLQGRRYWEWLGLVYQEQAICLYQALQDNISLTANPFSDAKRLIKNALDICRSHSIRGYPSALNRAGRIFGRDDPEEGLRYLTEGIKEARRLSDGWFWFANLIEYAELCYRAWVNTPRNQYRENISSIAEEVALAAGEYEFPDLTGRWSLLQGHLAIYDYVEAEDETLLDSALESYKSGFAHVAKRHVGSSGAASIPYEFNTFRQLFHNLPPAIQADWQTKLRDAWSDLDDGSTLLLARLEELY